MWGLYEDDPKNEDYPKNEDDPKKENIYQHLTMS